MRINEPQQLEYYNSKGLSTISTIPKWIEFSTSFALKSIVSRVRISRK